MNWKFLDTATGLLSGLLGGAAIALLVTSLFPPLVSSVLLLILGFFTAMFILSN